MVNSFLFLTFSNRPYHTEKFQIFSKIGNSIVILVTNTYENEYIQNLNCNANFQFKASFFQNVASFLVKDLHLDWRLGAEWFESMLVS